MTPASTAVLSHAIWTTEALESRGWFRFMGRSGGPNRPNYLNHLDALLGDDFGLDRPETLVRDAAVVQICGTKPVMVQIESALGQVPRDGTTSRRACPSPRPAAPFSRPFRLLPHAQVKCR